LRSHGFRLDHFERKRKKEAREPHRLAEFERKAFGLKAKLHHKKRAQEKAVMRKTIAMHQQRENKHKDDDVIPTGAVPSYLLDREGVSRAKVLSNTVKQKRKEKAGKWAVPLPAVRPIAEEEVFKVGRRRIARNSPCYFDPPHEISASSRPVPFNPTGRYSDWES
jgi:ribosome biogenesis protein NSA2